MNLMSRHQKQTIVVSFIFFIVALLLLQLSIAEATDDQEKYRRVIAMYEEYKKDFPQVEDIVSSEAMNLIQREDTVFVDVRKAGEQEVSMIPGAVTKETFLENIEKYRDKKIIAYCTISYRSGKFAQKMATQGITLVNLHAGLLAWTHAGGPLMRDNQRVEELHVYGKKWNLAPTHITTVRYPFR